MKTVQENLDLSERMLKWAVAAIEIGDWQVAIMWLCKSQQVLVSAVNEIMALYRKALQTPGDN